MSEQTLGEHDYEESVEYDQQPPPDIVAYNELRSCADLFRLHDSGQLEIQPDFQREVVWQRSAQTRFIDSLIKQLPIPSMCFSLDPKTRKWKVIDGLQRITTISKFLGRESWKLSRIPDVDPRLSGADLEEFKDGNSLADLRERVENLTIPITVIRCDYDKRNHMEFLFTIFHRLNSGGVSLNNQEIRNCIYSGPFNELLKRLDKQLEPWAAIKSSIGGSKDRFKTAELLLRFLALFERVDQYSGSLPKFLNTYMQDFREGPEITLEKFEALIGRTTSLIADRVLRHFAQGFGFTVWESILVGVAKNDETLRMLSDKDIGARVSKLLSDPQFSPEALRGALSGTEKVKARIEAATRAFA